MKIKALKIHTKNLAKQIDCYAMTLGLPLLEKSENQAVFQVGTSKLTLVKNDRFTPYHFAINIPANQAAEALTWLKERLDIIPFEGNKIQNFAHWNAEAIYFYDADQNIVELIARKNLANDSDVPFRKNALLTISEIGVPVNDIKAAYANICKITQLDIYDGSFERFCAIGDEQGLFICINRQKKDWFPTGDKAYSSPFEIKFEEKGRAYEFVFEEGEIISRIT